MLDGQIPAVIQEVVERSKLAAIYRSRLAGTDVTWEAGALTGADLMAAALTIQNQLALLREKVADERSPEEKAASIRVAGAVEVARIAAAKPAKRVTNNGATLKASLKSGEVAGA